MRTLTGQAHTRLEVSTPKDGRSFLNCVENTVAQERNLLEKWDTIHRE